MRGENAESSPSIWPKVNELDTVDCDDEVYTYEWQYERTKKNNGEFRPMGDVAVNGRIESSWRNGKKPPVVDYMAANGENYTLDLDTLIQCNKRNGCRRRVRRARLIPGPVVQYRYEVERSDGTFSPMDYEISRTIEDAARKGDQKLCQYKFNGQVYNLDLKEMIQCNTSRGCRRRIRRSEKSLKFVHAPLYVRVLKGDGKVKYKVNGQLYSIDFREMVQTNKERGCRSHVRRIINSSHRLDGPEQDGGYIPILNTWGEFQRSNGEFCPFQYDLCLVLNHVYLQKIMVD